MEDEADIFAEGDASDGGLDDVDEVGKLLREMKQSKPAQGKKASKKDPEMSHQKRKKKAKARRAGSAKDKEPNPFSFKEFVKTTSKGDGSQSATKGNDIFADEDVDTNSDGASGTHEDEKGEDDDTDANPFSFKQFLAKEAPATSKAGTKGVTETKARRGGDRYKQAPQQTSAPRVAPMVEGATGSFGSSDGKPSPEAHGVHTADDSMSSDFSEDNDDDRSGRDDEDDEYNDEDPLRTQHAHRAAKAKSPRAEAAPTQGNSHDRTHPHSRKSSSPPTPLSTPSPTKEGSMASRIREKMALLSRKLEAEREQNALLRKQHELDSLSLREETSDLRAQVDKLRERCQQLEKRSKSATAKLRAKEEREREEAHALENMAQQVEKNLGLATKRAVAAERKTEELQRMVHALRRENEQLKNSLTSPALEQVKLAASYLHKASDDAGQHIRNLMSGVHTLKAAAQILDSLERFEPL